MVPNAQTAKTSESGEGGARLTPHERRVLLEDIGLIAFTLARSFQPVVNPSFLPHEATVPTSPGRRLRGEAITSPLERLYLLSALWQEVQPALGAILRGPATRLAENTQLVRLAQARGGPKTASAVARSPHLAAAWNHLHAGSSARVSHAPAPASFSALPLPLAPVKAGTHPGHAAVQESRLFLSTNTWANRLTVRILADFAREARELGRLAAFCEAGVEAEAAMHLAENARTLRTHPILRDCPALSDSEAAPAQCASQIMRCWLPYQTLYSAWRQSACPLDFDWTHSPLLTLPALEPWHLYEIWCLLQVAYALHQAGWNLTRGALLQPTPRGLRLIPATGRASRLDFKRQEEEEKRRRAGLDSSLIPHPSSLSLYYQPLFSSANQRAGRSEGEEDGLTFGSRSHAMQPDMALHWRGRLIVLDPKFRIYAHMEDAQEDVNKMHAYRDAIVRRGTHARNTASPVEAAWCLFPGPIPDEAAACAGEVVAYPAASQEYPFGTAGVGALRLRPGDPQTAKRLAELLTFLLT